MPKRSKRNSLAAILACWVIAACGQAAAPTPTATDPPPPTKTDTPPPSATPTATPQPSPSPTPTPFGGGGQIAFASDRGGDFDIYLMQPDGNGVSELMDSEADYFFPAISAADDLMVWDADLDAIRILGANGAEKFLLVGVSGRPAWSPDGTQVAVVMSLLVPSPEILRTNIVDMTTLWLTQNPADDREPAWSPDGETIAFTTDRDGADHIYLMNANGSGPRRLTSGSRSESEAAWSPDGKMLAFASGIDGETEIFVVNADGTDLRQITDSPGRNQNPTWSADGSLIAFWSDRSGNPEIYLIGVDGAGLTQLTDDPAEDIHPFWVRE